MLIEQFVLGARVAGGTGHAFCCENSEAFAPAMVMLLMLSGDVPGLLRITAETPLVVETVWTGNCNGRGVSDVRGPGAPKVDAMSCTADWRIASVLAMHCGIRVGAQRRGSVQEGHCASRPKYPGENSSWSTVPC